MGVWTRALALAAMLAAAGGAAAQTGATVTAPKVTSLEGRPASFLFVGNSFYYYNNSMHSYFVDLLRKGDGGKGDTATGDPAAPKPTFRAVSATISGSGLNWHDMEGYFGKGMASYTFDENNNVVFNNFDKPFDAVVMNDCSQCPIHPQLTGLFHEYVKKHSDTIRAHGATPILFMTWAYADKPEMTAALAEQYVKAGNDNGLLVIPAGLAFAEALKRRPDLVLYQPDKRHPTLVGTYLGAATAYAAVTGRSPVGNPSRGLPAIGLVDSDMAFFLQTVAADTVHGFYGH